MNITDVAKDAPFCAGVVLLRQDRMVLTLNTDHLPEPASVPMVRLGGIGGGQEPGENPAECASREALEEVGVAVQLISSARTFLVIDSTTKEIDCEDEIAPLMVEQQPRENPDVPFRPDLPAGPYLYIFLYLAVCDAEQLRPSDVAGVLECPLSQCHRLLDQPTVAEVRRWEGVRLDGPGVADDARIWTPPQETLRHLFRLLDDDSALALRGGEP